jgi:hypothetical protein
MERALSSRDIREAIFIKCSNEQQFILRFVCKSFYETIVNMRIRASPNRKIKFCVTNAITCEGARVVLWAMALRKLQTGLDWKPTLTIYALTMSRYTDHTLFYYLRENNYLADWLNSMHCAKEKCDGDCKPDHRLYVYKILSDCCLERKVWDLTTNGSALYEYAE